MKLRCLLALSALLLLVACAPEPLLRPEPPAEVSSAQVIGLIEEQSYDSALRALDELLAATPDRRDRARLRIDAAEALLLAGQADRARALLDEVHDGQLDRNEQARLALARAELAVIDGDNAAAAWLLAQVHEDLPPALLPRLRALEQRLEGAQDRAISEAVQELQDSLDRGDFAPELALALLIDYPSVVLENLAFRYGDRPALAPWLDLAVTSRRFLLDEEQLLPALQSWQRRHPDAGYAASDAAAWLAAWREIRPAPNRVAVILPGPDSNLARPGRALRDGLMSAWSRQPLAQRPELMFFHIGDDPDQVIDAWFSARAARADFVIGPLSRDHVDVLLALRDATLPVLLLNRPTDPSLLMDFPGLAHALALTPEEEAELAAVRALVDGHRRALVLRQDSDWGDRVAGSFSELFTLGGGRIVRDMRYPTAQVDHSILLEVLLGLDRSRERAAALQRAVGVELTHEPAPRTDADLIFLASRAEDARAIRPQLNFFGVEGLPVMATSQVLSGAPDARRDHDLEQVLIPLAPWFLERGSAAEQRVQAERRYPGLDNPTLSRLFALGADAMALLPWLDMMWDDPVLYLAAYTGRLRLDASGAIERDLPFVRLVEGRALPQ